MTQAVCASPNGEYVSFHSKEDIDAIIGTGRGRYIKQLKLELFLKLYEKATRARIKVFQELLDVADNEILFFETYSDYKLYFALKEKRLK